MCLRPVRLAVVLGLFRAPPGLASTDGRHSLNQVSTSPPM